MKKKQKQVLFWVVALAAIVLIIGFWCISTWTAYNQLVSGLGQEPSILGYMGYLFATGHK